MVVLGGEAVSHERGPPVKASRCAVVGFMVQGLGSAVGSQKCPGCWFLNVAGVHFCRIAKLAEITLLPRAERGNP